jgi:hypothetical protein
MDFKVQPRFNEDGTIANLDELTEVESKWKDHVATDGTVVQVPERAYVETDVDDGSDDGSGI